ncbi:tRNA lysidine(34) synthetase TilS [Bacillus sp. FJAT-29814]|uniref:tRNA lysidine(34) synthetase TilS n=1 Tax=Bacillus sp. FJAT-29814 TaxID=1729688 RepID=UPI00083308E8|nr:tRNA lysidine(34) synthetase TilS [Bacillus sp. FJAT-29814]
MLEVKVEAFLKRRSFKLENKKIVVGVSGGPDSLALLHYLNQTKEKRHLTIIVAHVDHMFRGQESFEDALFVKEYCEKIAVPFEMVRINVPEKMKAEGKSSQSAAREARYDFYRKVMERYQAPYLALGHHGDDQMETMLMRFTRGSTGMARAGIPFSRPFGQGTIFRPFLCLTKNEILEYCERHRLTPRIDPSNNKDTYSRNRFRHKVLPFLKNENPLVHEHFQRFGEELQTDEAFLQELTIEKMNTVVKNKEIGKIIIDIAEFLEMPLPLQRRGIQLILNYLYKEKPAALSAVHIDQIFYLINYGGPSGELDLPGDLKVYRSYRELLFQFQHLKVEKYSIQLNGPGSVNLPNGVLTAEYSKGNIQDTKAHTALFSVEAVQWPLIIRTRQSGDRMTLKGMTGSKKLKDIFIDQKIPMYDRDLWPVITDRNGSILWLPGLKKSSFEGIEKKEKPYILLKYVGNDLLGGTLDDEPGY